MKPGFYVLVHEGTQASGFADVARRMAWVDGPFDSVNEALTHAQRWALTRATNDAPQIVELSSFGRVVLNHITKHVTDEEEATSDAD